MTSNDTHSQEGGDRKEPPAGRDVGLSLPRCPKSDLTMILSLSSDPQLAFWAVSQGLTPFPVLAAGQLMQVFLLLGEGEVG